jgi:hypothetical protein
MEFPEDIRLIISGFSKPRFKYFSEYNRALRVHYIAHWPNLKFALMTNPEPVLEALFNYENAKLEFEQYLEDRLETIRKKFDVMTKLEELHYLVKYGVTLS